MTEPVEHDITIAMSKPEMSTPSFVELESVEKLPLRDGVGLESPILQCGECGGDLKEAMSPVGENIASEGEPPQWRNSGREQGTGTLWCPRCSYSGTLYLYSGT